MAAPTLQMPGKPVAEDEVVFSKVTFWTRFRRHKLAIAGTVVLLLMVLAACVTALAALGGWLYWGISHHADISDYAKLAPVPPASPPQVRATFLGVSTVLLVGVQSRKLSGRHSGVSTSLGA